MENIKFIKRIASYCDRGYKIIFKPVQCSPGAPKWTQHIDNGHWYFEETYIHVLPKVEDYKNIARAMDDYLEMFN